MRSHSADTQTCNCTGKSRAKILGHVGEQAGRVGPVPKKAGQPELGSRHHVEARGRRGQVPEQRQGGKWFPYLTQSILDPPHTIV